jgi:hypothetical protein
MKVFGSPRTKEKIAERFKKREKFLRSADPPTPKLRRDRLPGCDSAMPVQPKVVHGLRRFTQIQKTLSKKPRIRNLGLQNLCESVKSADEK